MPGQEECQERMVRLMRCGAVRCATTKQVVVIAGVALRDESERTPKEALPLFDFRWSEMSVCPSLCLNRERRAARQMAG